MVSLPAIYSAIFAPDGLMHLLIVVLSILVFAISLLALSKKRSTRYLLLSVAFLFFSLSQVVTFAETLFLSGELLTIPFVDIHLSHLFDFLTLASFGLALVRNWDHRGVREDKVLSV